MKKAQEFRSTANKLQTKAIIQGAIEFDKKSGTKNSFIQAMAHWQLGEKSETRVSYDDASAELKGYEQKCEAASKQGQTAVPLPVQSKRLQAEAAALPGVTIPTAETAPEPAAKEEEQPQ